MPLTHCVKHKNGGYLLLIALDRHTNITVGKLGVFLFPRGFYLNAGSALNGLSGRIKRHLRKDKKQHWHIDYLLSCSTIDDIWSVYSEEGLECLFAKTAYALPQATIQLPGFGSSDCRCQSHLIHFPEKPTIGEFKEKLDNTRQHSLTLERLPTHCVR
ncbi:MAG: GIY-YIG nuclease family protein [Chloroflexi bacterium]|nr:GIY-YIG nuclease family protein [Chloroflexota bacterium]